MSPGPVSTTDPVSHVKITTATLIALVTTIVGVLCAIVPSWSGEREVIIAAATAVITTAGLVANAVHALAAGHAAGPPGT